MDHQVNLTNMPRRSWLGILLAGGSLCASIPAQAADVDVVDNITEDTTWTADNEYLLGGPIWVTDGATLTIEPGTKIYGFLREGGVTPGALVITRGSRLLADGTAEAPIVFTALEERDGFDDDGDPETPPVPLTLEDSSLWGGVVVLGRAILNKPNDDGLDYGEFNVEGFPTDTEADLVRYGGTDDDDDSGVIRYVSIRYGGRELSQDNEINGLTLGAVGRGTTIEYVEVYNNSDDGIEFFGGTVDTRYMVMAFNEDEAYDIDQGYRGRNQFWFAIQKDVGAGSNFGGEHDGGDGDEKTLEPFARSQVYNATLIGSGKHGPQENGGFRLKDNFAGQYHNSIFADFTDYAIRIDDEDTRARANTEGDLSYENNLWYDIATYDGTPESLTLNGSAEEIAQVAEKGNAYDNPFLGGVSRRPYGGLDPRPLATGPAYTMPLSPIPDDDFYEQVDYRGAFSADENWMKGWTYLDQIGYFDEPVPEEEREEVEVVGNITEDTVWSNDNVYLLGGPVWILEGVTLTIEAGTKIYGYVAEGGVTPGTLVAVRGAKLYAEGTRNYPVEFTAIEERDGFDDDGDPETPGIPLTLEDSSLWGGVMILGRTVLNKPNDDGLDYGEFAIEGFPTDTESDLVNYGGTDDEDNSGILRFVSIRYGGRTLSQDNEINGLTLGAVGRGTTIEYVEVFNNSDDGIEFFGGTVDTRYMVMAFNEDEAFDIDQGFRGRGQFWFGVQKDVGAGSDYGGEHDGGDGEDKTLEPLAEPKIYNATYIGGGMDNPVEENAAFRLKDNFAGQYHNSIFTDFRAYAIRIDDADTEGQTAEGRLRYDNNTWFGFGPYDGTLESLTLNGSEAELLLLSPDRGNVVEDPMLSGISRTNNGVLNPLPMPGSPVLSAPLSDFPEGQSGFFQPASFRGAFGTVNWMTGWTYISREGYLAEGGVMPVDRIHALSVAWNGSGNLVFQWESADGEVYDVEYSGSLNGEWMVIGEGLGGVDAVASFEDTDAERLNGSQGFYRAVRR